MGKFGLIGALGAMCGAMIACNSAHAGGFMLQEQSQVEIGRAFAGAAAAADTPSTVFYNPAGMTELEGFQISTGVTALFIKSGQADRGSTRTGPSPVPTLPVGSNNGGNPFASIVPIPTTYATMRVGDSDLWLGFGISSPFGLKLRYDDGFFGRYDSTYSKLLTIDAQPSFAYKINDTVSIGGGMDIQYIDARLESVLPQLNPATPDGDGLVRGDDVSLGWNAGVLFKLAGGARFGVHYRSRIEHDLKGDFVLSGLAGPLAAVNGSRAIHSPLVVPDTITAGLSLPLDGKTQFMATGRFYNWSVFKGLRFNFQDGTSATKQFDYRDSWSLSVGLERKVANRVTVRAGGMFDRTPTNPRFLSTRVPDGDRSWLSTGLTFDLNNRFSLNASYAHVFIEKQTMNRTDAFYSGAAAIDVTTYGQSSGNVDMIATSLTARF